MSIRVHDRYFIVAAADSKITMAVLDVLASLEEKDQITNIELAGILCDLPNKLALKWALREERHGDVNKKADEA